MEIWIEAFFTMLRMVVFLHFHFFPFLHWDSSSPNPDGVSKGIATHFDDIILLFEDCPS